MTKGFGKDTKKYLRKTVTESALQDPKAQILSQCLQAAVPMEIVKIYQDELSSGISLDYLIEWERQHNVLETPECAFFIVGMPDQHCGKTGTSLKASFPGVGASVFARLARHIAVMSFVHPVDFLGASFSAEQVLAQLVGGDLRRSEQIEGVAP